MALGRLERELEHLVDAEHRVECHRLAHAAGLTDVIIPERNRPDLEDVPEDVRDAMTFHPVMTVGEVLDLALEPAPDRALQAV